MQHFLDLTDNYGKKGYFRLWGGLFKPVIHLCAPDTMKRLLKTAGKCEGHCAIYYYMIKYFLFAQYISIFLICFPMKYRDFSVKINSENNSENKICKKMAFLCILC